MSDTVYSSGNLSQDREILRSGVITNRRANYYTLGEGDCTNDSIKPKDTEGKLQTYATVYAEGGNDELKLRNMKPLKNYIIKYFSPYDQANPLKEENFSTGIIGTVIPLSFINFKIS